MNMLPILQRLNQLEQGFKKLLKTGGTTINSFSGGSSIIENIGVFYVSRNFTGVAGAIVTGETQASITSANDSYNVQFSAAKMGDQGHAYPDPWSARNAALQAISAGTITKAHIKVLFGSEYTVGSDVAANNGSAAGVSATATVADIGFATGDSTTVSSLMKNNLFYFFEENTSLTMINKTYSIHAGCYNVDATHTEFNSAIYGKGTYTIIYGSIEGVSQRFIQVNNSRASVLFEADKCTVQGPWFYTWVYKIINCKMKTFVGDKLTMLVHMQNGAAENNGDTSPSIMMFEVENVFKGYKYFPYASANVTAGYRPLIALDYSSATRLKTLNFKLKNVFNHDTGLHTMLNGWATGGQRDVYNHSMTIDIDYFQHDLNVEDQAAQTVAGALFQPISHGNATSYIRDNVHTVLNIKAAIVEHSLVSMRLIGPTHASSKNSSLTVNIDYVVRKTKIAAIAGSVGIDNLFTIPYLMQTSSGVIAGEKVNVTFNVKKAIAKVGNVFGDSGVTPMKYGANTVITGCYVTEDGSPVILLEGGNDEACFLKGAALVAKGAATNSIMVSNGALPVNITSQGSIANLAVQGGITEDTAIVVNANLANYL